jgi:hypothetical protein
MAHAKSYDELKHLGAQSTPPGHVAPLTSEQITALNRLTDALNDMAVAFQESSKDYPNNPLPEPELRARSLL